MAAGALRVCAFESRRGAELASLIRRQGAEACIAPSLQEVPLEENDEAVRFGSRLLAGEIDDVVFLTGVGTDALLELLNGRFDEADVKEALQRCRIVVRGPKPVAALRPRGIRIDLRAPEPNTWREVTEVLESAAPISGRTIAVQEYGEAAPELDRELAQRGARVVRVPIYRWALPDDVEPLRIAIEETIAGAFDVLLFTSARQISHVLQVAERDGRSEKWLQAAGGTVVGSIGPTCSAALRAAGLAVDVEASPTKMGQLVTQTLAAAPQRLRQKR